MTTNHAALALTAANWWADAIKRPKFDNGADDQANQMAQVVALVANAKQPDISDKVAERFTDALGESIERMLDEANGRTVTVGVDYGPDRVLSEAAVKAGIVGSGMTTFPWKTVMWIHPDGIEVRHGYAAPVVKVEPVEEPAK